MTADIAIAAATGADAAGWRALREALWPGDDHAAAIAACLATPGADRLTLVATIGQQAIGFAEATLRHDYVNGCDTSPVVFLEGLYVDPSHRRHGIANRLIEQVAIWGRAQGVTEFASDAGIDNFGSHALHRALGFDETERVVFFRRILA